MAWKANTILGCTRKSVASRSREVISCLIISGDAIPGGLCPLLGSSVLKRHETTGEDPVKGTKKIKIIRRLENLSSEERLGEMGLFGLEETERDLTNAHKYLKNGCQEDGVRIFSVVPMIGQGEMAIN